MDIVYREMTMEDYDGFIGLWKETPGMSLNDFDETPEGMERFFRRNPGTSFIALDGDTVIGTVLGGNDGRRGYIYHMAVKEGYKGNHIGKTLAELVIGALKRENVSKVCLTAFSDNGQGNGFWEHLGFPERNDIIYRSLPLRKLGEL